MYKVIENSKIFCLWKEVFASYEMSSDIRYYMVTEFYSPFVQAQKERIKIADLVDRYKSPDAFEYWGLNEKTAFYTSLRTLLTDKSMKLDIRIRDGRIEDYVWLIRTNIHVISTLDHLYMPVIKKGLLCDSSIAFELLYIKKKLGECEETLPFIKRAFKRFNQLPQWDGQAKVHVQMIALYCLAREIYKPVWKWFSIWGLKTTADSGPLLSMYASGTVRTQLLKLREQFKEPYRVTNVSDLNKKNL